MKTLIKLSFSRFSESYDREAVLQKEAARILVDFAGDLKGKGIDLGCGTGFLLRLSEWKGIVGIDISEDMVRFYSRFNKNAVIADMEDLPFKENSFDYAVSNFSLQWADFDKTVSELKRVLKPEGRFVFNIPVGGSLEIVEKILGEIQFDFICVPEVLQTLKEKGFFINDFFVENLQKEFKDGYLLLVHLHKTGVAINTKSSSLSEKRRIVNLFKSYKKPALLNYKLLFVDAFIR
ncbi:MAG TPA: methyltransferase domain-containing protein [Persephonella sp.]|nr:methyltransferase domain-containing protein [Persephonella sp.]